MAAGQATGRQAAAALSKLCRLHAMLLLHACFAFTCSLQAVTWRWRAGAGWRKRSGGLLMLCLSHEISVLTILLKNISEKEEKELYGVWHFCAGWLQGGWMQQQKATACLQGLGLVKQWLAWVSISLLYSLSMAFFFLRQWKANKTFVA